MGDVLTTILLTVCVALIDGNRYNSPVTLSEMHAQYQGMRKLPKDLTLRKRDGVLEVGGTFEYGGETYWIIQVGYGIIALFNWNHERIDYTFECDHSDEEFQKGIDEMIALKKRGILRKVPGNIPDESRTIKHATIQEFQKKILHE